MISDFKSFKNFWKEFLAKNFYPAGGVCEILCHRCAFIFYFLRLKKIDLEQFWHKKNDLEQLIWRGKKLDLEQFWAEKNDLEQMPK